jgi:beta-galactosidase
MLYSVSEENTEKLAKFVENGGKLVCTYMTGMVNENDRCHLGGFPGGKLKDVFGIWNEEIDTLYPGDSNKVELDGVTYKAVDYCELIHAQGAEVLATYSEDFYAGMPAITVNNYGKGKAYYTAFRGEQEFNDAFTDKLLSECAITSDFDGVLPYGMTAHSRTDGESVYVFLQNYTTRPLPTSTKYEWITADDKEKVTGDITLAPYETLILSRKL